MIRLSREIRFALVSPDELEQQANQRDQKNSWSAWPNTNRIVPQLRLSAVVEGTPDPVTGYLCNVTLIDDALRSFVFKELIPKLGTTKTNELPFAERILQLAFESLRNLTNFESATVSELKLHLSPFLQYSLNAKDDEMIQLTHQFEFSAAHRLHCDSMSAEENIATFGKCNNPAGHGHNYVVEVSVSRTIENDGQNEVVISLGDLSQIVNRNVIDVLDHKNLNEDIEQFAKLNPSVENICAVIFDWLKADIESAGCNLAEVKVYETPKTWASYCG